MVLRLLAERLGRVRELTVGALTHPSSRVSDFYREMGELFCVPCTRTIAGAALKFCASALSPTLITL